MNTPGRKCLMGVIVALSMIFVSVCSAGAGVTASVDENPVIAGESVELSIEAEGEKVRFPKIREIGGYRVTEEGMQRFERMEGNRSVVSWVKLYAFTPKRSLHIPSLRVEVDGRTRRTEPIDIRVDPAGVKNEGLVLDLLADRKRAYVGQPIDVKVRFMERRDIPVMNVDFVPMTFEHFWGKQVGRIRRYREGAFLVHEKHYLLFPQHEGNLTVGPMTVKVAVSKKVRDAFGFIVRRPQWVTLRSNPWPVVVEPLPQGVSLVGRFTLDVQVNRRHVIAGEPVELMVEVSGKGNVEDIRLPAFTIAGVTIYRQPSTIVQRYEHGLYRGSWRKKYILVADRNYTIPSLQIHYFDPANQRIEKLSSAPIAIEVRATTSQSSQQAPEAVHGVRDQENKEPNMAWIYMNLALAFLLGMGTMAALSYGWRRRRRKLNERGYKIDEHRMLQRLMPHISSSIEAANMAENLYAALFEGKAIKVDKKAFAKLMEKLEKR